MVAKPATVIVSYVLEHLASEPLPRRIEMLRTLAEVEPSPSRRTSLVRMADELADIERRHQQLLLEFNCRHA